MQQGQDPYVARFLKRLQRRSALTGEEQRAILRLNGERQRFRPRVDIISPEETVKTACLVAIGLVARFDQMLDSRRQLTSFYIAGDMCDLHSVVAPKASWSITAVSHVTVIRVPHVQLVELCTKYPAIALAFWRDGTADASTFAKWVGNFGRKNAKARVAHLICEMGTRSEAAGLGIRTSFDLPMSQEQLGEATGMTGVHVNRTLQQIRREGLLTFANGRVEIFDWDRLTSLAEFDPAYLLLEGPPHRVLSPKLQHREAAIDLR